MSAVALEQLHESVKARVARLISQALLNGTSPSEIHRSFGNTETKNLPATLNSTQRGQMIAAMVEGNSVFILAEQKTYLLHVESVFPDLQITLAGKQISPLPGQSAAAWAKEFFSEDSAAVKEIRKIKSAGKSRLSLREWLLPNAVAAGGLPKDELASVLERSGSVVFEIGDWVDLYRSNYSSERIYQSLNRLSSKIGAQNRLLSEISGTQRALLGLSERLNSVRLPTETLDLADRLRSKGDGRSAALDEIASGEVERLTRSHYDKLLESVQQIANGSSSADEISCKGMDQKPYVSITKTLNGKPLTIKRTRISAGGEAIEFKYGNVTVTQYQIKPMNASQFEPLNAVTQKIITCVDASCKEDRLSGEKPSDAINKAFVALNNAVFRAPTDFKAIPSSLEISKIQDQIKIGKEEVKKLADEYFKLAAIDSDKGTAGNRLLRALSGREQFYPVRGSWQDCIGGRIYYTGSTPTLRNAVAELQKMNAVEKGFQNFFTLYRNDNCMEQVTNEIRKIKNYKEIISDRNILNQLVELEDIKHKRWAKEREHEVAKERLSMLEKFEKLATQMQEEAGTIRAGAERSSEDLFRMAQRLILASDQISVDPVLNSDTKASIAELQRQLLPGATASLGLFAAVNAFTAMSTCCVSKYCSDRFHGFLNDREAVDNPAHTAE